MAMEWLTWDVYSPLTPQFCSFLIRHLPLKHPCSLSRLRWLLDPGLNTYGCHLFVHLLPWDQARVLCGVLQPATFQDNLHFFLFPWKFALGSLCFSQPLKYPKWAQLQGYTVVKFNCHKIISATCDLPF